MKNSTAFANHKVQSSKFKAQSSKLKVQNSKFKVNAILDFSPGGIRPDKRHIWNRISPQGEDEEPLQEGVSCNTCNGENSKCEQECMMEAATKEIEYYDDEDLDRFAGRDADAYTDEEVEEFSEVLYTMAAGRSGWMEQKPDTERHQPAQPAEG